MSQNDAGSGGDAGDTPYDALLIANGPRVYSGNLTPPGSDMDWYRHDTASAFCTKAESTLTVAGAVTLAADSLRQAAASRSAEARTQVRLALAGTSGRAPLFGIEGGPSIMATSETGPKSPGRYTFSLQSLGIQDLDPEGDGEWPEAGSTHATAAAVPGSCFAGRVTSEGDPLDGYYVDVGEPRDLTLSLAVARGSTGISLRVLAPDGTLAATLANGEAADVRASPGRWHLVVAAEPATAASPALLDLPLLGTGAAPTSGTVLQTDYLIGLTDGPGSNPCRPSCI